MERKQAKESNPFQVASNVSTPEDIPAKKSPSRLQKNSGRNSLNTALKTQGLSPKALQRTKTSTADKSTNESQGSGRKSIPEFMFARPEGGTKRRNTITSMKTPSSKTENCY